MFISHNIKQIHTGKCYNKIPEKMIVQVHFNDRTNEDKYQLKADGSKKLFFFNLFVVSYHEVCHDLSSESNIIHTRCTPEMIFLIKHFGFAEKREILAARPTPGSVKKDWEYFKSRFELLCEIQQIKQFDGQVFSLAGL